MSTPERHPVPPPDEEDRDAARNPVPPVDAGPPPHPTGAAPEFDAPTDSDDSWRNELQSVEHTRTRATFFGLVIGAVVLVLLLVFILQNLESQQIMLLFWEVNLPLGVSLLIAAIAGALVVALAGGLRMFQLSRALKKAGKR